MPKTLTFTVWAAWSSYPRPWFSWTKHGPNWCRHIDFLAMIIGNLPQTRVSFPSFFYLWPQEKVGSVHSTEKPGELWLRFHNRQGLSRGLRLMPFLTVKCYILRSVEALWSGCGDDVESVSWGTQGAPLHSIFLHLVFAYECSKSLFTLRKLIIVQIVWE